MAESNGKAPTTVFHIDDLVEPGATLIIGGVTYHYVRWSALSLLQRHAITKRQSRIDELEKLDDPTAEDATEYDVVVRELIELATDVPPDVIDGLDAEKRQDCASLFLALRLVRRSQFLAAIRPPEIPTSATSSPASTATGRKGTRKRG